MRALWDVDVIELALILGCIALPFHFLVRRELGKLNDPRHLRTHGVVIVSPGALETRSEAIGTFMGHPIWESVTFKGMRYRFDRVIDRRKKERIEARELYLEPGLVYVTD